MYSQGVMSLGINLILKSHQFHVKKGYHPIQVSGILRAMESPARCDASGAMHTSQCLQRELSTNMRYEAPTTTKEAATLLAREKGESFVLAGGTDLLVRMKTGLSDPDLVVG